MAVQGMWIFWSVCKHKRMGHKSTNAVTPNMVVKIAHRSKEEERIKLVKAVCGSRLCGSSMSLRPVSPYES
jgi:hypothetical protein